MKNVLFRFLSILMAVWVCLPAQAQYDDLYYDPDADYSYNYEASYAEDENQYAREADYAYGTDNFSDYDYYYTSRIRRFHRPYRGFDFFSPAYVDVFYYDPWLMPGATIYFDSYFQYRRWRNWNRWRRWNQGWGPGINVAVGFGNPWNFGWGWNQWNSPWGWNQWNSPWGWNAGWGGFGWGGAWGGAAFNNFYGCPVGFTNFGNVYYNTTTIVDTRNNRNRGFYYGPRNQGTVVTSRNGRVVGRGGMSSGLEGNNRIVQKPVNTTRSSTRLSPNGNIKAGERTFDQGDRVYTREEFQSIQRTKLGKGNVDAGSRIPGGQSNPDRTSTNQLERGSAITGAARSNTNAGKLTDRYEPVQRIPRTRSTDIQGKRIERPELPQTRTSRRFDRNVRPYQGPSGRSYERPSRTPRPSATNPSDRRYNRPGATPSRPRRTPRTTPNRPTLPKSRTTPSRPTVPRSRTTPSRSRVPRTTPSSPSRSRSKTTPSRSRSRSSGSSRSRSSGRRGG